MEAFNMKTLKTRSLILLVLLLASALVLSACGTAAGQSSAEAGSTAQALKADGTDATVKNWLDGRGNDKQAG